MREHRLNPGHGQIAARRYIIAAPMYERGLDRNDANYVLTPLHSLDQCAELFPQHIAIVESFRLTSV